MFGFSRKTDYALVALAELAIEAKPAASATDLAERTGIPLSLLRNILKQLAGAGLLIAERGPFGGYALTREASAITVLEALEAVEGRVTLTRCCADDHAGSAEPSEPRESCSLTPRCRISRSIAGLDHSIRAVLRGTTIADLVAGPSERETPAARGANTIPLAVSAQATAKDERSNDQAEGGF